MYISIKYQHYVDIHHHRIYEFVRISNFMLFVNKQTFDASSDAGVQCVYGRNVGILLTKTWKQLTIIMESWHSNNLFIIMTLWHTCSGGGGGVWYQTCHFY